MLDLKACQTLTRAKSSNSSCHVVKFEQWVETANARWKETWNHVQTAWKTGRVNHRWWLLYNIYERFPQPCLEEKVLTDSDCQKMCSKIIKKVQCCCQTVPFFIGMECTPPLLFPSSVSSVSAHVCQRLLIRALWAVPGTCTISATPLPLVSQHRAATCPDVTSAGENPCCCRTKMNCTAWMIS